MSRFQNEGASPSATAVAVAIAIVSGTMGYYLGLYASLRQPGGRVDRAGNDNRSYNEDETDDDADADDHRSAAAAELSTFPDNHEECKLVLVVRTDLGMTKGKMAAQCSHATLACYKSLVRADRSHPLLRRWERRGQAKVALKVDSEDEMLMLQARAQSLALCTQLIHDAGRTQIAAGSATVLGIGPAPKSKVDQVTAHLKLL